MKAYLPLLLALALATPLHAQPVSEPVGDPAGAPAATAALSEGVVRKIDAENGKITLRHGPLGNLDMPPMTMVFRADPPSLLEGVKIGDKVRFRAEEIDGVYTVTAIEPAP
jgi:Cu/Ag efflux protein CusF